MKRLLWLLLASLAWGQTYHDAVKENANVFQKQNTFQLGTVQGPVLFANLGTIPTTTGAIVIISDGQPGASSCSGGGSGAIGVYLGGAWHCNVGGIGTTVIPQVGDCLRWNVNGDNQWDAVNCAPVFSGIYASNQTAALTAIGYCTETTTGVTPLGTTATVNPTAVLNAGNLITSAANTASPNTIIGINFCENGNVSKIGLEAFYRWSFRFALGTTTNARYWMGLGCHHATGAGNNGAAILGTPAYASDAPNKSTVGFFTSAGTFPNWQATAVTAGGSQTNVDTGVAADTNPHLFEMTTNLTGTSVFYFIDGVLKATISTNLPPPANTFDSWGDIFFTGDNKNQTQSISLTFYSMQISLKL